MKRILLAGLTLALAISCAEEADFRISGTTPDIDNDTKVYLQKIDENNRLVGVDTTVIKEGEFSFDPTEVKNPEMMVLGFEAAQGTVILIAENQNISVRAYKDSLYTSKVNGGKENDFFKLYYNDVVESNKKKNKLQEQAMNFQRNGDTAGITALRAEFEQINTDDTERRIELIEENTDKYVSIIVLSDLVGTRAIDANRAEALFDKLDQNLQEMEKGVKLKEMIAQAKEREAAASLAEVGNKAPEFTAPTPNGEQLSLQEAMGSKYTIIDFWASWCKPCREENPNVVNVYNQYHDKGLNIISVSLDRESARDKWLAAIENDKMTWYHVSNLMEWQDPIARKYGITAIPATYLLDSEGVIIEKNLRGEALVSKMQELLGEG
ncbi:redoxin domain-containing protein [Leeuwenhoekiella parthenopeia]|uniref:AhpC/TSA family protein n=1 Tax=Leeuwenhoekiella parthenopeia TaxID=2890320 RepID=A0ABS8GMH8_9FLAO|nr:redoxin domain-containing protein [Leeuwenhoekiella parthenopeia]MCC4211184.1 AhpC/TSA family protein [Leeuwenhoekiella parthenopeia]